MPKTKINVQLSDILKACKRKSSFFEIQPCNKYLENTLNVRDLNDRPSYAKAWAELYGLLQSGHLIVLQIEDDDVLRFYLVKPDYLTQYQDYIDEVNGPDLLLSKVQYINTHPKHFLVIWSGDI